MVLTTGRPPLRRVLLPSGDVALRTHGHSAYNGPDVVHARPDQEQDTVIQAQAAHRTG